MNLALQEEQALLVEQLAQFARDQLTSQHPEHSPEEANARFAQLAAQGVLGLCIPESLGGLGLDAATLCRCLDAVGTVDASLATMAAVLNGFVAETLIASEHPLRDSWLEQLQSGVPFAFFATHGNQPIAYAKDVDEHHFKGQFHNIPMAANSQHWLIAATDATGNTQLYPFADMTPNEQARINTTQRSLGLRDAAFGTLALDWRIEGGGTPLLSRDDAFQRVWLRGQTCLAAVTVGVAKAALRYASAYAQERKQFGKPIAAFQAIQWKIADMAMAIEGASLLVDRAAYAWSQGNDQDLAQWAYAARHAANEAATQAGQEAIQIHGGYGFTTEFPVEKLYRDAHALRCLYPPTSESLSTLAASSIHHL